jgi:hypothetical protein
MVSLEAKAKTMISENEVGFSHPWYWIVSGALFPRMPPFFPSIEDIQEHVFCARHRYKVSLRTHSALQVFRHYMAAKICELLCSPCVWKSRAPAVRLASQRRDPLHRTTRISDPLGNAPKVQHMMHLEPADALGGPSCAFVCPLAPCRKLRTTREGSARNAAERRSAALSICQRQPRAVVRRRT